MAGAGADLGPAGWALLPGLLGPAEVAALREESGSLLAAAALGREGHDEGGSSWGWIARELGCVLQVAGGGAPAGHAEAYFRRRAEWPHFPGAAAACVCNPRVLQAGACGGHPTTSVSGSPWTPRTPPMGGWSYLGARAKVSPSSRALRATPCSWDPVARTAAAPTVRMPSGAPTCPSFPASPCWTWTVAARSPSRCPCRYHSTERLKVLLLE